MALRRKSLGKKKWCIKTYPNCPLIPMIPIQSFLQLLQPIQALRQRCSQSGSDVDGYGKRSSVNSTWQTKMFHDMANRLWTQNHCRESCYRVTSEPVWFSMISIKTLCIAYFALIMMKLENRAHGTTVLRSPFSTRWDLARVAEFAASCSWHRSKRRPGGQCGQCGLSVSVHFPISKCVYRLSTQVLRFWPKPFRKKHVQAFFALPPESLTQRCKVTEATCSMQRCLIL